MTDALNSNQPIANSTDDPVDSEAASEIFNQDGSPYAGSDAGKIGVTGAVFLILNKMIGTGSMFKTCNPFEGLALEH